MLRPVDKMNRPVLSAIILMAWGLSLVAADHFSIVIYLLPVLVYLTCWLLTPFASGLMVLLLVAYLLRLPDDQVVTPLAKLLLAGLIGGAVLLVVLKRERSPRPAPVLLPEPPLSRSTPRSSVTTCAAH